MSGGSYTLLFDLDGTLIDSAPDLAGACNDMRLARGLAELPYPSLRAMVGSGARGMVGVGFGLAPGDAGYDELREEFLRRYELRMTQSTVVFADVLPLLASLRERGLAWGIVTNKAERFAEPLVAWLGLRAQAGALVCGDTTPHSKPHPAPLLEAARRLGADPVALHLRRRRSPRRRSRARRRHGHRRRGLGLPRRRRAGERLGCRSRRRPPGRIAAADRRRLNRRSMA